VCGCEFPRYRRGGVTVIGRGVGQWNHDVQCRSREPGLLLERICKWKIASATDLQGKSLLLQRICKVGACFCNDSASRKLASATYLLVRCLLLQRICKERACSCSESARSALAYATVLQVGGLLLQRVCKPNGSMSNNDLLWSDLCPRRPTGDRRHRMTPMRNSAPGRFRPASRATAVVSGQIVPQERTR
jgi:hypothetical protein